jgi:microcystin-dependent protein
MSDQYLGEIRLFSGNYAPENWAFCNGQLLKISENEALYAVLGVTYGGDGVSTFGLPDLRGRVAIHTGTSPVSKNVFPLGQKQGVEEVTLTVAQLPTHTHTASGQTTAGTLVTPKNNYWATSGAKQYGAGAPNGAMATGAITGAGNSVSHENMMPFMALSYIIALQGVFPSPA